MRKIIAGLCLLSLLCGCSTPKGQRASLGPAPLDLPAERLAQAALEYCGRPAEDLERLDRSRDTETLSYYLTELYGLEPDSWEDCAVYRAGGAEALEVAVLRMKSEREAKAAAKSLAAYIAAREGDFTGYEPEQAELVRQSRAEARGLYAALLICPGAETILPHLWEILRRTPFVPPGKDDMTLYDTSAILAVWEGGDAARLTEEEWEILNAAAQLVEDRTDEKMTDLEKETTLYRWLTYYVRYDEAHFDALAEMDHHAYTPYGPLVNQKAVCLGYATAFQLLMDMAGVECITVVGASRGSTRDHAWNMVRLDGLWHCVDVTWDEGVPGDRWRFFNVSSEEMAATDHQWDYAAVPEAAP